MRTGGMTDGQTDKTRRDEASSRFSQFLRTRLEMKHYQTAGTLSLYFNAEFIFKFSAARSPTRSGLSSARLRGAYGVNVSYEDSSQLKFSV
jgi:hypothetical protein